MLQLAKKDFIPPHGSGGLFGGLCLNYGVTSAVPLPRTSCADMLPRTSGSIVKNAEFGILTGVTPESYSAPATSCDGPGYETGNTKLCVIRIPYGCMSIKTQITDIKKIGMLEACEVEPPVLVGGGGIETGGVFSPSLMGMVDNNFSSPGNKALYELYAGMVRLFGPTLWTGDGSTLDPTFTYPVGFDQQISDSITDVSGIPCPRANSYVHDFLDVDVCTDPTNTYIQVTRAYRTLQERARVFGLNPASWLICMRAGLFWALTDIWPCENASTKCGGDVFDANANPVRVPIDASGIRDDMRANFFLWIDGNRVPVQIDDYIPEDLTALPLATSGIRFLPIVYQGNRAASAIDWFNYKSPIGLGDPKYRELIGNADNYGILDQGRFLIIKNPMTSGCTNAELYMCVRPVIFTPQIAGRIDNMGYVYDRYYEPTQWDTNQPDFLNGGQPLRPVPGP